MPTAEAIVPKNRKNFLRSTIAPHKVSHLEAWCPYGQAVPIAFVKIFPRNIRIGHIRDFERP